MNHYQHKARIADSHIPKDKRLHYSQIMPSMQETPLFTHRAMLNGRIETRTRLMIEARGADGSYSRSFTDTDDRSKQV